MVRTQSGEIASSTSIDHPNSIPIPPKSRDNDDESMTATVKKAGKDILFGSIAGMVSEIFEYPFDLAKVRLQSQLLTPAPSSTNIQPLRFNGPMDCLTQTWKEEGMRGLYRGLPAPIVGSMAETASIFVAYTAYQNAIRTFTSPTHPYDTSSPPPLSISQLGLAAGGAGFLTSFVITPIELIKCKMQVQMMNFHPTQPPPPAPGRIPRRSAPHLASMALTNGSIHTSTTTSSTSTQHQHQHQTQHTNSRMPMCDFAWKASSSSSSAAATQALRPPGPIALIRSIVSNHGLRGLWLGHTGTILRETGGTASWFVVKEWFARILIERRTYQSDALYLVPPNPNTDNTELYAWESAVSGALAGAVGALLFYPADTVKSAIQTEEELRPRGSLPRTQSTFLGTFRKMWATHGLKGLYAGCGMTVARAVPSSGIIFVVYDGLTAYFA